MLKYLVFLFVVLSGGAFAAAASKTPDATGQPHVCTPYYPEAAVRAGAQGTTTTSFTVTAEGRVVDPSIRTSSGNADLDAAALTCVGTWTYKPATAHGIAITMPWVAAVQWKLEGAADYQLVAVCNRYHALNAQALSGIGGVTGLTLRVMADGTVSQAAVARSSGDPGLDDAAVRCMDDQRYDPVAMKAPADGLPTHAQIDWRAQLSASTPLAPPFPAGLRNPEVPSGRNPCSRRDISARPPSSPSATTMQFTIAADGQVQDVIIKQSSGSEALDRAAAVCAAKWHYIPAMYNGLPQAIVWTANVDWRLR